MHAERGWGVRYGFTAEVSTAVNHSFQTIVGNWYEVVGNGPHTYEHTSMTTRIVSPSRVQLLGNGYLQVEVRNGTSTGGSLAVSVAELIELGFSVGTTSGSTVYYRLPVSISTYVTA